MEKSIEDLHLTATLMLFGAKLSKIEVTGKHGTFFLTDVNDEIVSKYYNRSLSVEPQAFMFNVKSLTMAVMKRVNNG